MPPRISASSAKTAAIAATLGALLALPVLAQERPESILPPGFGDPAAPPKGPPPRPTTAPVTGATAVPSPTDPLAPAPAPGTPDDSQVVTTNALSSDELALAAEPAPPPPEYPASSRRDPNDAGVLPPANIGLTDRPWGGANGLFLTILMRQLDAPVALRWAHIGLRNALMVKGPAPFGVLPQDWAAERAWLLVRLGEADGARLLTASIDTSRYTPKLTQVAAQVALANSDPAGLCAIEDGLSKIEKKVAPLVQAICASLSGEPERAAADIEAVRRRGQVSGIDLALADKVVGAGEDTGRAVTIQWEPVTRLSAWRYGLASATGTFPPDRLVKDASAPLKAWMARSPILSATQKIEPARTAAALGVMSSDAYVDLYSAVFDRTAPDDLGDSDGWKLRQAFVARKPDDRLSAMRDLWGKGSGKGNDRLAAQVLTARAATLVRPDAALGKDAPDLVASMLAAGFDQAAARWTSVLEDMDNDDADRCWAMIALGAPSTNGLVLSARRIEQFAGRDQSKDHRRTALLVAGLVGLGRIDGETAGALNARYSLGLSHKTRWTELIDGAAARRQSGSAMILAASGFQGGTLARVPALYLFHSVNALRRTGQDFLARMIAAEALARS